MKSMSKLYFLLLFSYLFVFHNSNECDESHCLTDGFACYNKSPNVCSQNCRPKYGETTKCFLCDITNEFYSINTDDTCGTCTGEYILSSKECLSSEPTSLYKLGEIYYKECPLYSNSIEANQCDCENKYYEENFNGKTKRTCLSPTSACPTNNQFYDYGDKKCYSGDCTTGKIIKKYETNGSIRCHSSCIGEEFYKKLSDDSEICLDSCDRYIFYDSNNNKKYCQDECSGTDLKKKNKYCINKEECDFYADDYDYCVNSCEEINGKNKHNVGSKECIESCADPYKYMKNNVCYKSNNCNYYQEVNGVSMCLSTCNVGEGFLASNSETPKKCYSSCAEYSTTNKNFNHGENICIFFF